MLYIIIPVHNRINFTIKCLESLYNQTFKKFEVIIIDDGSTDGTSQRINEEYPQVKVLPGDGNMFWTKSINLGIRYALRNSAKLILTLNNDTLASPEFIEKMMYWHNQKPDSLLGAFAFDFKTNKPVYAGEIINWNTHNYTSLLDKSYNKEGLISVSHFPGRGLLIPSKVFDTIGLYDEKGLPHYLADYDFTHRAKRNGFNIYCNYDAKLYVFPEESGDRNIRNKRSLNNYFKHLFDIKGGGNLIYFTRYAWRNCPVISLPSFLLIGYTRRIIGYLIK